MLKEVLVVEGKMDTVAIKKAVDAETIETGGFTLAPHTLDKIKAAYEKRGIIILTDPDGAGERIRTYLTERFPKAGQAFVPKELAIANHDLGIEQASPQAIRDALSKVHYQEMKPRMEFNHRDLFLSNLNGSPLAAKRRAELGAILGLGYGNAKQFLRRLNNYGITREEFQTAVEQLEESQDGTTDHC